MESASQRRSPYQGLIPYEADDALFFFGREKETRLIAANLFASPLTLLYGASGVGKSSILRAGVINHLRARDDVLVVEFHTWQTEPLGDLQAAIAEAVASANGQGVPPADATSLAEYLAAYAARLDRRLMVILDQFEEYFLYHPQDDAFAQQFPTAVMQPDAPVSFLIAIREDALAKLDRFEGRIPILFDNYLRIEHLDRKAARAAITEPIKQYNHLYAQDVEQIAIEPKLIEAVLEQVETGQVILGEAGRGVVKGQAVDAQIETPYLQLVMTRLWDEELRAGSHILRLETMERLGGAERIVRTHLDVVMSTLLPDEQEIAASIFHYLVTPSGTKIAHAVSDLAEYAQLPQMQLGLVLEKLCRGDVRILRPVAPLPDQPTKLRYEIFHDVLDTAVLDWRARYLKQQELAAAKKREAVRQRELEEAQTLAEEERRRAEEQAGVARRLRRLLGMLVMVSLLVVGVGIYAWIARGQAVAARLTAEQQARLSLSRELAAAAINNLGTDPQISGWLALHAASVTYAVDKTVTIEAENALHRAVPALRELLTLTGHTAEVLGVAFSPDGTRLATTSYDGTAKMWDASSGRELLTLAGHTDVVAGVAFSPDGAHLATASADGTAKVWDVSSGRELLTLAGHTHVVFGVAFSPDGTRLATASYDGTAKVWDASSGRQLFALDGHTAWLNDVAFSPDGARLATASGDKTAKVWDASSGQELLTLTGHTNSLFGVAFSPNGTRLATTSADKTAKVWDASSGRELLTLTGHTDLLFGVAFSPDGTRLATASHDGTAKVWNASSGRELVTLAGHTAMVVGVAFSSDGTRLATASYDHTAKMWDASSRRELLTLADHTSWVVGVAFSPDGTRLATTSDNGTAKVWDASSGRELLTLTGHTAEVVGVGFSPDGTRLATTSDDRTARIWDASSGRELLTLAGHDAMVVGVGFSPDGTRLATTSDDRTARIWDASSGQELLILVGHTNWVRGLAFSPDGTRLVTTSNDQTAKVWDTFSGRELLTLVGHRGQASEMGAVFGVAFSPDGTSLATASRDKTAKVWDASSGRKLFTLAGHTSWVVGVAFSPDGTRLATASADHTAKVWDVLSGRELLTLAGHTDLVYNIVFSPNGARLATASDDGTVRVYTLNNEDLMALVRARMTRSLTSQECQTYLHEEDRCPLIVNALNQVVEGNSRTRAGDVDSAIASFRRALELDPTLRLNPEADARRFAAEALVGKGQSLVKAGDIDSAVSSFQRALELDPTLRLNPEADARRFAAEALVGKGRLLVRQSKVKDAIAAYAGAERLVPTLKIPAGPWKTLCWFGSLWRHADEVMFACEKAVELQPDNANIRDSRGIARAMTGDIKGAIEDFQEYLKKVKDFEKGRQRLRWVIALRAGEDPFTDEEIKALFYQ